MNSKIKALLINYERKVMTNEKTGEVTTMFSVNYAVETSPYKDHYGPTILNSYCSANAQDILNANLGKYITIELEEKPVFGKQNMYKKVVSKINDKAIRQF